MKKESDFLRGLVGKPVRLALVNEHSVPPMRALVLAEISALGIVASDSRGSHFFPWNQIVMVTPAEARKKS